MSRPRILICGGRDFTDKPLLYKTLSVYRVLMKTHWPIIITGYDPDRDYPPGADKMAFEYTEDWDLEVELYPYHYHLGKKGGGSRNQEMLDKGKPDFAIAFPTPASKGTWDMVRRLKKAGVKTLIVEANGPITKDFV